MRLAAVRMERAWAIGAVTEDLSAVRVLDPRHGTVDDVVRGGADALQRVRQAANDAPIHPLREVQLGSPLQRFNRDILCTGWNYVDHFYESAGKREGQDPPAMPQHPTFFTKGPDAVIGPYDDIAYDANLSTKWDYEAELGLVIGRDGRSVREEDAMNHVFGWFVANDVSQRDLQRAHGGQWLKGKSIDSTTPLGPWVTTVDDVVDPAALDIECDVNGEARQRASTAHMAFAIPRLLAELSRGMTLRAGDVLLTGTPSGIGNAREPRVFLQPGDRIVTRVSGLGCLHNTLTSTVLVCTADSDSSA